MNTEHKMFGEEQYWRSKAEKILDKYSLEEILERIDLDEASALMYLLDYGIIDDEDVDELLEEYDD